MTKVEKLLAASLALRSQLAGIVELLVEYENELNRDGLDSLAATDYLNAITRDEMCIQQFTNRVSDIEGSDDDAPEGWDSVEGGAWSADDWALNSPAKSKEA